MDNVCLTKELIMRPWCGLHSHADWSWSQWFSRHVIKRYNFQYTILPISTGVQAGHVHNISLEISFLTLSKCLDNSAGAKNLTGLRNCAGRSHPWHWWRIFSDVAIMIASINGCDEILVGQHSCADRSWSLWRNCYDKDNSSWLCRLVIVSLSLLLTLRNPEHLYYWLFLWSR